VKYLTDRNRRQITFSKRKGGLLKKAQDLNTLTGAPVFIVIVSEAQTVFTWASRSFESLESSPAIRNKLEQCVRATAAPAAAPNDDANGDTGDEDVDDEDDGDDQTVEEEIQLPVLAEATEVAAASSSSSSSTTTTSSLPSTQQAQ
jgi:MADS-box transcription factor